MKNKIPSFNEFIKLNNSSNKYPDFMSKENIEICEKIKRGEIKTIKYDIPHQPIIYI